MAAAKSTAPHRSAGPGRLGMFLHLILRSLTARSGRLGIALAAITVGAAVVSALTNLYFDISIKMSEELRAFGANVIISPQKTGQEKTGGGGERGVDAARLTEALHALPKDKLLGGSPFLYGLVRLDLANAVLVGVDFPGLRTISPYWQVQGSWVSANFDERNAMVGRRLAESMELTVGKTVTITNADRTVRHPVTVRGIIDTGDAEDDQIFVNLSLAEKILNLPGKADFMMASVVLQANEADTVTARLGAEFPDLNIRPIRKISQADGQILEKIQGLMALVAGVILVITTLCVNATLTAMVAERTPQIGLQKAIGASNRDIVVQFLSETAVIAVIATALGLGFGFLLAQALGQAVFGAWVTFRPIVIPLTLFLSLAAALAASILPVRGAIRIAPARVLRGE